MFVHDSLYTTFVLFMNFGIFGCLALIQIPDTRPDIGNFDK